MMKVPQYAVWFLMLNLGLLSSCETMPTRLQGSAQERVEEALAQAQFSNAPNKGVEVPRDIDEDMLAPLVLSKHSTTINKERRFDFRANKAPAREIFISLAEGTDYSVIVDPSVKGTISLDLKDTTLLETLDVIRTVHGYDYTRDGNRITILGKGLKTRIFPVNYLNLNRRGTSKMATSSANLSSVKNSGSGSRYTNTSRNSKTSTNYAGSSVNTTSNANFWSELKETLSAIIGDNDDRKVIVSPQVNLVIVRAFPRELDMVENYINVIHKTVNRQVVIEAKIIEVELKEGFQSGINWALLNKSGGIDIFASQKGGGTLLNSSGSAGSADEIGSLLPSSGFDPVQAALNSGFGGMFSLILKKDNDFVTYVELLKSQGEVQVLSSPRVSTVNNQKAVIKVGGDEFFITSVTNSATTTSNIGGITATAPAVVMQAFFSGIALDVTPQIDEQDNIILHIHPTISNVEQTNKNFVIGGDSYIIPTAASNIQESDNIVRATSGQIIVIGGLMKEASTEEEASVPLLGDLPLIGKLFRHKKITRIKKELVILLKPTVISKDDQWRQVIKESQNRIVTSPESTLH